MERQKVERVAAYVRVSTQEQKLHGLSLDAQKMKLTTYAKEHNMKIVGWYVDEGVSARKLIKNRPELQRMVQDAEAGQFERIIFIKLDRFFRSVAEYHECMKRIAPVVWSATEEKYDLTTANGRMMVNAKLMIAELEADTAGERVKITNDYKVQTGRPLSGSQPFGFTIAKDEKTGQKKVVRDPENEEALRDTIQHYLTHQSRKKSLIYLNTKYQVGLAYKALKALLANTMLYGEYRGNPSYCEPYIDKDTFEKIQEIARRNVKMSPIANRHYIFSGLLVCPVCGARLKGTTSSEEIKGRRYVYKRYRCPQNALNRRCAYNKSFSENAFERLMLAQIEDKLDEAKLLAATVSDGDDKPMEHDLDAIHAQIDRLNYSWQTGKIRTVEQYEKDYAELIEKMELAEAERRTAPVKDFGKVENILHDGWRAVYDSLDDAYKRAFWRSFVQSIEVNWEKGIDRVNFF
jgi:DNA invertase Pin-like site-specific DNA recombinase